MRSKVIRTSAVALPANSDKDPYLEANLERRWLGRDLEGIWTLRREWHRGP
jgi:hypothetical protein